ncbi:MAG: septum formation initiator family protein [Candidatus Kapaibacterium sp.]
MAKISRNAALQRLMTRKRLLVIAALTSVVLVFIFFSNYGVITRLSLLSETAELEQHFVLLQNTADSLRRQKHILETDSTEIERLARERYGYVRPNEEVFIINRDTTATP